MRVPFIAGNWKMHKTIEEAVALAKELVAKVRDNVQKKVMIAPPFTALYAVSSVLKGSAVFLGAQNMAAAEKGAHTGEISVHMLKDVGVSYVIIGHSERRHVYGENDQLINKKVKLALSKDLNVILCVGETLEERERGIAEKVVEEQLVNGLQGVESKELTFVTIAYEPVWAIGTGKTATPEDADAMHVYIRKVITNLYDKAAAAVLTIQYGGSVKPNNIKELMAKDNIDGALVGGASLESDTFLPIIQFNNGDAE
ncbi:MAG: triose-phosphate isomerase [Spirochaetales bacterium]|nr:triose-phosphate isomerase [Spirochaetales bacterium]